MIFKVVKKKIKISVTLIQFGGNCLHDLMRFDWLNVKSSSGLVLQRRDQDSRLRQTANLRLRFVKINNTYTRMVQNNSCVYGMANTKLLTIF